METHLESSTPHALGASRATVHEALAALLSRYERSLYTYIVVLVNDDELAADCVQDTFLRAYENLGRGRPVTGQWLYKVGRNRAFDEFRRRRKEGPRAEPPQDLTEDTSHQEQVRRVQRALSALSPSDREVLYLAEVDGFSGVEIAQMLGTTHGAIRMRLSRAHARFRRVYGSGHD